MSYTTSTHPTYKGDRLALATKAVRVMSLILGFLAILLLLFIRPAAIHWGRWYLFLPILLLLIFFVGLSVHFCTAKRSAHPAISVLADVLFLAGFGACAYYVYNSVVMTGTGPDEDHCAYDEQHGGELEDGKCALKYGQIPERYIAGLAFYCASAVFTGLTLLMSLAGAMRYQRPAQAQEQQQQKIEVVEVQRGRQGNTQRATETVVAVPAQPTRKSERVEVVV